MSQDYLHLVSKQISSWNMKLDVMGIVTCNNSKIRPSIQTGIQAHGEIIWPSGFSLSFYKWSFVPDGQLLKSFALSGMKYYACPIEIILVRKKLTVRHDHLLPGKMFM